MRLTLLEKQIQVGSFHLHMPDGKIYSVGKGEPVAHMILHRASALTDMLQDPEIAVGECYMNGDWDPGEGGLLPVFEVLTRNFLQPTRGGFMPLLKRLRSLLLETSPVGRSRDNVHHHYDLDEALFRRFLDADMHYSCAYFAQPGMTLEAAQQAKCRHIARKLLLKPGDRVLDIGSGWGGLALYLAEQHQVNVTGLTLSDHQFATSIRRTQERGMEGRVAFRMQDYREHEGQYDAIVSAGMFEHVGRPQYQVFFDHLRKLLKPGGRVLLHSIGRSGPPATCSHWIQKYIFPGGYIPALSEVAAPLECSGLVLDDLEVLRLHYAETLKHWHQRFQLARTEFEDRMGERFCRMWEFYLQVCEAVFRWGDLVVFQLQITRENDTVPVTRDYLHRPDARNAAVEPIGLKSARR